MNLFKMMRYDSAMHARISGVEKSVSRSVANTLEAWRQLKYNNAPAATVPAFHLSVLRVVILLLTGSIAIDRPSIELQSRIYSKPRDNQITSHWLHCCIQQYGFQLYSLRPLWNVLDNLILIFYCWHNFIRYILFYFCSTFWSTPYIEHGSWLSSLFILLQHIFNLHPLIASLHNLILKKKLATCFAIFQISNQILLNYVQATFHPNHTRIAKPQLSAHSLNRIAPSQQCVNHKHKIST